MFGSFVRVAFGTHARCAVRTAVMTAGVLALSCSRSSGPRRSPDDLHAEPRSPAEIAAALVPPAPADWQTFHANFTPLELARLLPTLGGCGRYSARFPIMERSCDDATSPYTETPCLGLVTGPDPTSAGPACSVTGRRNTGGRPSQVELAWVAEVLELLVGHLPAPCEPLSACAPTLVGSADGYSFTYYPDENEIAFDAGAFEAQMHACRHAPDGRRCLAANHPDSAAQRVRIVVGNIAHELGHWYLRHSAEENQLYAFCTSSWCDCADDRSIPPLTREIWHELYADFIAGFLLATWRDRDEPLDEFFYANGGGGSNTHPHPDCRARAIERGSKAGALARAQYALGLPAEGRLAQVLAPVHQERPWIPRLEGVGQAADPPGESASDVAAEPSVGDSP
jgi:hypothetical protein